MLRFEIRKKVISPFNEELVHDCPHCGGRIVYNIKTQGVTCPYCQKIVNIGIIVDSEWYRLAYHKNTLGR